MDDFVANFNDHRENFFSPSDTIDVYESFVCRREAIGSTMAFHNTLQLIASPRTAAKSRTLHVVAAES